jgi:serine phosphatase RsbU (regulator of sigma subunit)/CHASE1-domain containing sensor protein
VNALDDRSALLEGRARIRAAKTSQAMPVAVDSTPPPGRQPVAEDFLPTPRRRRPWLGRLALVAAVALAVVGPLLAWWVHDGVARDVLVRRRIELDRLASEEAQRVREQVIACAEQLYAIGGFYDASQEVNAAEFARFTANILSRHQAVAFAAWAPRDPGAAGAPDRYHVSRIQPEAGLGDWVGRDLAAQPALARAIERARGSAEAVLTDAHELVMTTDRRAGALLALHVGPGSSTGAGGVLVLALDGSAVLRRAAASMPPESAASITARLFDADVLGRRTGLGATEGLAASDDEGLVAEAQIHVAGQDWRFVAAATPRLLERIDGMSPWLAALLAFLGWELFVGALVGVGLGWRGQALHGQARMTGHVLHRLTDAVLVTDRHGKVRLANEAALRMLRASEPARAETLPMQSRLLAPDGRRPLDPSRFPLARALAGETVLHEDARLRMAGGQAGPVLDVRAQPLLDEHDALHGAVLVLRDVSDQQAVHETRVEMVLAGRIQQRLYPQAPPDVALDVAGSVLPATFTAGDYYDWLVRPDGSVLLAVGDVSGHGAGPAIVMAEVCAYVRALAATGQSPAAILRHLHERVASGLPDDMFVSLLLVAVDPASRRVTYANAGHPSAWLLGADGALKAELTFTGSVLRRDGAAAVREVEAPCLLPGDVLTLLTDGVTELRDRAGELFGEERVGPVVRASRHERAAGIVARLQDALTQHGRGRPAEDDVTLVVVKG